MRVALGCSQARLMRQFLTESALLAMLGGAASIVVGYLTANLLGQFLAEHDNRPIAVTLDFRILAIAGAITMLALLVFGLFPAWRGSRMARGNWVRSGAGNVGFAPTRKWAAGRLLVIAPNRSGMWAHLESTPFGHGQPYSFGQIGRLLAASLYRVERRDTALYLPPSNWRLVLRGSPVLERTGRRLLPGFAGVTITEAVKDIYAAMPVQAVARRRLVLAEAA